MKQELMIRQVQPEDATLLRELARRCPPLDVHTHYTYWVIARYFGKNSFIAEQEGRGAAYITSVENNDTLLIWQIGITEALRGRTDVPALKLAYHTRRLAVDAFLTDDPVRNGAAVATLPAGTYVLFLGYMYSANGVWAYTEVLSNNQIMRGFLPVSALEAEN